MPMLVHGHTQVACRLQAAQERAHTSEKEAEAADQAAIAKKRSKDLLQGALQVLLTGYPTWF